jgi:hypothetical protein
MKDLGLQKIDILPYHRFSEGKYERLAQEYALRGTIPSAVKKKVEFVHRFFEKQGLVVRRGG